MSSSAHTPAATGIDGSAPPKFRWREPAAALIGNVLEWFDIGVYALLAVTIGRVFFPSDDPNISLMLAFGTFGATYLIRPVGALVLGAYADRAGRKAAMTLTLGLMALGTFLIAVMPSYASIGAFASIGIVIARLLQGFSAGGEFGTATAFLTEHAPPRLRAFFGSLQFVSQGMGTVLGSLFAYYLTETLSPADLQSWGWRVPFLFGLLIIPVGIYIRQAVNESPQFEELTSHQKPETTENPVVDLFKSQKVLVLISTGCIIVSTSSTFIIKYMPSYASSQLGLRESDGFLATLLAGVLLTCVTPFVGYLADRIGRLKIMISAAIAYAVCSFPIFYLLNSRPSLSILLLTVGLVAMIKIFYYAALPSVMSDIFPVKTRSTGMNLSYNVGVTLFGGFAPLICTILISLTGSPSAPGMYLSFAAVLSICALAGVMFRLRLR